MEQAINHVCREQPSAATVWTLLRILERVTLLIGAHVDAKDVYRIGNREDD
jgi:hypothetical protein